MTKNAGRLAIVLVLALALAGLASWTGRQPALAAGPAAISITPTAGPWGSSVTVTGANFAANESGIAVTYDGVQQASGITARPDGSWTASFVVSFSNPGSHNVNARGAVTPGVTDVPFSVPGVTFGLSTTGGLVGTYLTATGAGFGSREGGIMVTYDGNAVVSGISANAQGIWNATFAVPPSAFGTHNVAAYGSTTPPANVPQATFTVNPGITLLRTSAAPGTSLIVTGSGFAANETGIAVTFDSVAVSSGISATNLGAWTAVFNIPASPSGPHNIAAYGALTSASTVTAMIFTVTPGISLGKSSGASGSPLTVTGAGFSANEGGITLTFDGSIAAAGLSANGQGGWTATFAVPLSASGPHSVVAYGSVTQAGSVPAVTFSTTPALTLGRSSGTTGVSVTVSGSGFAANEGGITLTIDGAPIASGISANAQGAWSASFTVPAAPSGSHSISAYGTVTQAGSVGGAGFTIGAAITLGQTSGAIGSSLKVSGSGFAANESGITVTFDGVTVASGISANAQGAWSATFAVPPSASGSHNVAASGSVTQASGVGVATFNVGGGLSLGRSSGSPGTSLTISGAGFAANESAVTVTYDGVTVASGLSANGQGAWSTTVTVPPSASGLHVIAAYGSATPASSVPAASFTVNPGIIVGKAGGAPGSSLTVNGAGFAANEGGVTVTFEGAIVASGISANGQGAWSTTFTVPASSSGPHSITAYGSITQASGVGAATFTVGGGLALNRAAGNVGSSITVTGTGFATNEPGITVTYDGATVASNVAANGQGAWSATFIVPPSASGPHNIAASGSSTPASNVPGATFTVNPGIAIDRSNGIAGASIAVSGSGFAATEGNISITYDGSTVVSGVTANAQGSWSASFAAPPSGFGQHSIKAAGQVAAAASVPEAVFTINPSITIAKSSGAPGSSLTVSGSGFASGQTGVIVSFDGAPAATGVSANAQGSWSANLTIPGSASGSHSITAYGPTTPAASIPAASFIVTPSITISSDTGAPGASLMVSGAGFAANEVSIVVALDGVTIVSRISANAQGGWSAAGVVPASVSGPHTITASGAITQTANVPPVAFKTTPVISVDSASGYVGMKVTVSGAGFAGNSEVKLTYDGAALAGDKVTTDGSGSFSSAIPIPVSRAGNHTIAVQDGQKNESRTSFAMDATAPPVPALLSPKTGSRIGFVGDAAPTFQWSEVNDPSGVTYRLQVSASTDFSRPVLDKSGLTVSSYAVTRDEALPLGEYRWRVLAIDGASNQSAWSQPYLLDSGLIAMWALIAILVAVVALLLGAIYALVLRARRRQAVAPPAVPGYWREVRAEEPAKPRGLPWRRALPTPEKGMKALSSEEQARIKVVSDFAQSLPLVEPGYTADWMVRLMEADLGEEPTPRAYEQWLQGQLLAPYQPEWMSHPLYKDLRELLEGQPLLRKLDEFVDTVNRCSSECLSLLQEIYTEAAAEAPDLLARGGFAFIGGVYSDAIAWHRGKSLREPSPKDYVVRTGAGAGRNEVWLQGAEGTAFSGPLVRAEDEMDAARLRSLHLKLRRDFRGNDKAKQLVSMIAHVQVQRANLITAFGQLARS